MNMTSQDMEWMSRALRHRLRNIASGVKAATALLANQLDSRLAPSEKEYFPLIAKECDALAEVARRLSLLLDGVPGGKPGQLGHIVAQACHALRVRYPLVNVRFLAAPGAETARVSSDAGLLAALNEILANAAETGMFGGEASSGREVVVRYACLPAPSGPERSADVLEIVVHDGGRGIAPGDWPVALQPFRMSRADRFGIGLAIAVQAIAAMGGTLQAQQEKSGFNIIINLPLEKRRNGGAT